MKSLSEIEFAINYLNGHADEDKPEDFPIEDRLLTATNRYLFSEILNWVLK